MAVALVSDLLSVGFEFVPPLQIAIDVATALALWFLCGWRWPLLPALIVEAIPGLSLFPTWSLVVGTLPLLPGTQDRPEVTETGRIAVPAPAAWAWRITPKVETCWAMGAVREAGALRTATETLRLA